MRHWFYRLNAEIERWLGLPRQIHELRQDVKQLDRNIRHMEGRMANEFQALTDQVTANTDVIDSAIKLIQNIHDLLVAAGTDPVKLQALADALKSKDDELAAAVVANTPTA